MRATAPLIVLCIAAALLGGCGGTEGAAPRRAGDGSTAAAVRAAWERSPDCRRLSGASRWGCRVGRYRCQGVVTDRGWSIDCARPGRSIAFTVRRG